MIRSSCPRDIFLERIAAQMTRLETLRLQESARQRGTATVNADLSGMPLTRLATYVLFTLSGFLPSFRLQQENHIGEAITDDGGRIAYLKTFRLSKNQVRRGHLLSRLAANDWHLADTAADLGIDEARLGMRLESAGFAHLLRLDILDGYRKRARTS